MSQIPFYSLLTQGRWSRAFAAFHRAHAAGSGGRNAPCPCGSGKKFKNCCGLKANAPPEQWLDSHGKLRLLNPEALEAETRQDALHMARMERVRLVWPENPALAPGATATECAAAAGLLREDAARRDAWFAALRQCLAAEPLDLSLDYQRVVFDLVKLAEEMGRLEEAIEAQSWWVHFLDDFGQRFHVRMRGIDRLHKLLIQAGRAEPTQASYEQLVLSLEKKVPDRTSLLQKIEGQGPGLS